MAKKGKDRPRKKQERVAAFQPEFIDDLRYWVETDPLELSRGQRSRLAEDPLRDRELADVVEQRADAKPRQTGVVPTEPLADRPSGLASQSRSSTFWRARGRAA